jgi:hypothetical protein
MGMKGLVLLQCAGVDISGTADSLAFIQASLLLLLLATSEGDFLLTGIEYDHLLAIFCFQDNLSIFTSSPACLVNIQDAVEFGGCCWYHGVVLQIL